MRRFRFLALCLCALLVLGLLPAALAKADAIQLSAGEYPVTQDGAYSSLEEVAVYLHTFGQLPQNFITKKQAMKRGWDSRKGNLADVAPGCSIGGDHFGNYENNPDLPAGQQWTECDINATGGFRNGERIVFSKDGLIYYSDDHYNHFAQVIVSETPAPGSAGPGSASAPGSADPDSAWLDPATITVKEDGSYTSKDEVAAFIHRFAMIPYNYHTKAEAKALGWNSKKDNLGQVAPGYAIGGDAFGNREKLLPQAKGRVWWECDVNTQNGKRGKERLVFSNDGLIYYTCDDYQTFEQLY